jgi:F-type H+-transporting ATPase subunit b
MTFDPNFWYTLAFLTFFLLLGRMLWRISTQMLDEKTRHIRKDLEEAAHMKKEAGELLELAKQKKGEAQDQARQILALGEREIKRIRQDALKERKEFFTSQERQLEDRLTSLEGLAFKEVNENITRLAVDLAEKIIKKNMDKKLDSTLIQKTIKTAETLSFFSLDP